MTDKEKRRVFVIDGEKIHDIASFYGEINRVFMADENWSLGESLDALDDMLYGGYGALQGDGPFEIVWRQMEKNRSDLGYEATRASYLAKLSRPESYNAERIQQQIDALDCGEGPTYFDTILEILEGHPRILVRGEG